MSFTPTAQQQAIVDAFAARDGDVVITAGAGSGKTSTLKLLPAADRSRRGLYLAYNSAIAKEASASFPSSVMCKTAHSLAFGAVGREFAHRLKSPRMPARETARLLRINEPLRVSLEKVLAPTQLANVVMRTIERFCQSGDPRITAYHVPRDVPGADDGSARAVLAQMIVPIAQRTWNDDLTKTDGRLKFTHDCYLKMWQLSDPMLSFDYVMLDEAQDTNGVVAAVFDKQIHTQRVAVGDANQAIYGWRGAMDYMTAMTAKYRLSLTQSFRFGPAIADEANKWLTVIDSDLRITGTGTSAVQPVPTPHAILCRTNAEAVASLIRAHDNFQAAALVGGGRDLAWFADAADQLRTSGWTSHPELMSFSSWGEVQDYVENDHGGDDFKVAVKLIETYGTDGVKAAIDRSVDEKHADVVISTAHKAKGREWATVRIANDFTEPRARDGVPGMVDRAEAMLAYVAVTRARKVLDRDGLAWIDNYLDPEHVGLFDLVDTDSLLAGFATLVQPAPAAATPAVVTHAAPAPPRYRVLAVDGNPLSEWMESYEAACKLLRGHPDADRLDTSTAATAA